MKKSTLMRRNTNVLSITRAMRMRSVKYPKYIIPFNNRYKVLWDSFLMVLILWLAIFIPWQVAFPNNEIRELDIVILIFFIIDFLITFRTTYFNENNEEVIE